MNNQLMVPQQSSKLIICMFDFKRNCFICGQYCEVTLIPKILASGKRIVVFMQDTWLRERQQRLLRSSTGGWLQFLLQTHSSLNLKGQSFVYRLGKLRKVRRFKVFIAAAADKNGLSLNINASDGLIQVITDNFDARLNSQNGMKQIRGLVSIFALANCSDEDNK